MLIVLYIILNMMMGSRKRVNWGEGGRENLRRRGIICQKFTRPLYYVSIKS